MYFSMRRKGDIDKEKPDKIYTCTGTSKKGRKRERWEKEEKRKALIDCFNGR